MSDPARILRDHGIGLVDDLIRAAELERLPLPAAATIIEKESRGRNIWGADGGLQVRTNGTYKPRTPVTRQAYEAYRREMRAKRIIRQGCGPAQCTSAQYQDTADALGGCWVPLANMRSGFRGMAALMRAHGTRGGARRYNGSGPRAEAYADDFMRRHGLWVRRLAGHRAPPGSGRVLELTDPIMTGADVADMQTAIGMPPAARDGKFGPGTDRALRAWQAQHGLVADGKYGPRSRKVAGR